MIAAEAVLQDWYAQWAGRRQLGRSPGLLMASAAANPSGKPSRGAPSRGAPLAMLNIPRLGMSVVVLEGTGDAILKRGPGHIEDTAYPGEHGNVAIAGHRDTHFRPLRRLRPDDEIALVAKGTTIRYFVDTVQILQPTDMDVLDPTPEAALTLVTCYPFEFIGNAPMRFVVRATPRTALDRTDVKASR
jgi:LPXTG-site transpeptidase (sortase) family protein